MRKVLVYGIGLVALISLLAIGMEGCQDAHQPATHSGAFEFREKLSDYHFFKGDVRKLDPVATLIAYELSTPLFSDYTVKNRFIVLPKNGQMVYTSDGLLDFPDSTIIIKNFAYRDSAFQKIMIETRLLVKDPFDHLWKVMDYVWNAEQTDADRTIIGASLPIKLRNDQDELISTVYKVPNTNDCKRCHNNNNILTPIGPKARNLNIAISGGPETQLQAWASQGWLKGFPGSEKVSVLPNWKDSSHYSLEQRARAYLDVNCAHCHTKGGDAFNTGLFLNYEETDRFHVGVMKEPVSAGGGAGGLNYDVIPKDYPHSILAYRMNSAEPGTAMPELGRSIIHKEGVRLIQQWINSMNPAH